MRLPTTAFNGFHAVTATVSKTLLVRFDYNKYAVAARALGRPAEVHAYADRIVVRQGDDIVAEHARRYGRDQTIYDPWHYVPVLALDGVETIDGDGSEDLDHLTVAIAALLQGAAHDDGAPPDPGVDGRAQARRYAPCL